MARWRVVRVRVVTTSSSTLYCRSARNTVKASYIQYTYPRYLKKLSYFKKSGNPVIDQFLLVTRIFSVTQSTYPFPPEFLGAEGMFEKPTVVKLELAVFHLESPPLGAGATN